jgi:hypothetical protein
MCGAVNTVDVSSGYSLETSVLCMFVYVHLTLSFVFFSMENGRHRKGKRRKSAGPISEPPTPTVTL